ncbi:MAG: HlyD family efflux transporter periplasmic adaptor subunit [Burkholderiales bacterium]|nr:HlyD family efflux transporter periplasmic adaptor subunit [Burkholderiales bacterium]
MITRESNSQRKSLRVAIPLYVEIAGASYAVRNWSTTGMGVVGLDAEPESGTVLPAKISFPMLESTLTVAVELVFRARHEDVCGFDFHELSARNKRVLRHYIELSVDGKLGDVEDIVAVAAAPMLHSPVDMPLNLAQPGAAATLQNFRTRNYAALFAGVLVLAGIGALLFYNLAYKVEGTGFVSGSIDRVTANYDGRVARILVQPHAYVEANSPLFTVENPVLRTEIESMEQHVAQLQQDQGRSVQVRVSAEAGLLATLQRDARQREAELSNARHLFDQGVITQRDLMLAANNYSELRSSYLRQVADGANRTLTYESVDQLNRLKMELAAKKLLLARQESAQTVRAPRKGKVFQIDKGAGEYVAAHDPVVLLESDVTPAVLLRLPNDDALKLRLGMPATIYVPFEDRKYGATVSAVGLAAVNAASPATMEGGLNETLVKLEFDDREVRLPVNARVNVWVRTFAGLDLP